jgi:hypothetical protein
MIACQEQLQNLEARDRQSTSFRIHVKNEPRVSLALSMIFTFKLKN